MDREEAKFLLTSFRPDGADAGDVDFAEALALAAEDRALGAWLSDEREVDSAFAKALESVAAPAGLRERILVGALTDFGGVPQAESELDARMIGAMASVQVPGEMRRRVLAAMAVSQGESKISPNRWWRKAAWPVAAAAGIAMAFLLTGRNEITGPTVARVDRGAVIPAATVPVEVVQASFIRTFESPLFDVDQSDEDHGKVMRVLEKKKLPCPKCLPPGLVGVQTVGCRELVIDGKRGSLVCFDEPTNGTVHLVIFKRSDVCGDLPRRDKPAISQHGPWAVARWVDEGHVFVLLGSRPLEKLASLF